MLRELTIQNFVIVERTELEFGPGFTVLTGETGAGKSILIDALAVALGERGDAQLVRAGAERAEIHAEFAIAGRDDLYSWLLANDLEGDADSCQLRRVIDSSGRSRAYVNGHPVTLQQLREAGEWFIDIHGQHAHQSLLKPSRQRELLDSLGGATMLARSVQESYRVWSEARRARVEFEQNRAAIESEREALEWQVKELTGLGFDLDEWATLEEEGRRLANASGLLSGAQYAFSLLSESDGDCLTQLGAVESRLGALTEYDHELESVLALIEPARINLAEAAHALRQYCDRLDLDPERLAQVEARIDSIHTMARKYRSKAEELPQLLAQLHGRLDEIGQSGDFDALLKREHLARERYLELGEKLSQVRRETGARLALEVVAAMEQLSMAGGRFQVSLSPLDEGNSHGLEEVEFLVSANPGAALRPLHKIASGGELSRLSLAIQVYASRASRVPTLIFDEVDVGIGGGVAEVVGRLLHRVGEDRQVLCVTHLPQVAAQADAQWTVRKTGSMSVAALLDREGRINEIARMLGGIELTDTTLRHAAEMLGFELP